jgi:hypothetical protein
VRHVPWRKSEGSDVELLQCRVIEAAPYSERPDALHDNDVLVNGVGVWQNDVAGIVVNPDHEGRARLVRVAPDPLHSLPRWKLVQRHDAVSRRILCLRMAQREQEHEQRCQEHHSE